MSNPHHLIRPFNSTQSSSRGPPGLAGHSDGEDDDVDDGDEDDENSILRSGKQPDPPPYDHSNCSNSLHKSCACVSFIAEHTKAREEATKVGQLIKSIENWSYTRQNCLSDKLIEHSNKKHLFKNLYAVVFFDDFSAIPSK